MISNTIEQLKGGNMPQRHQVTTGLLAVIFVITIMFLPVPAAAKRVALVIGNSAYEHVEPLRNPGRDAEAVASMFDSLGFDVIRGMDLDQQAFAQTLQEFEQALDGSELAAFYFAGHGLQFEGRNHLISTGAQLSNPYLLAAETFQLRQIVELMEANSPVNLVFVDACRDSGFLANLRQSLPKSRSAGLKRGLTRVNREMSQDAETMILFATSFDNTAADGQGDHSPFANALIQHLPAPDTEISLAMKRVVRDVREATGAQQRPELVSNVAVEIYLKSDQAIQSVRIETRQEVSNGLRPSALKAVLSEGQARDKIRQLIRSGHRQAKPVKRSNILPT